MIKSLLDRKLKERRSRPMTNNYEVATVIELGNAQDVVLGEKIDRPNEIDSQTLEVGTRYIPATDDNE
jgi:hypothetical protein